MSFQHLKAIALSFSNMALEAKGEERVLFSQQEDVCFLSGCALIKKHQPGTKLLDIDKTLTNLSGFHCLLKG